VAIISRSGRLRCPGLRMISLYRVLRRPGRWLGGPTTGDPSPGGTRTSNFRVRQAKGRCRGRCLSRTLQFRVCALVSPHLFALVRNSERPPPLALWTPRAGRTGCICRCTLSGRAVFRSPAGSCWRYFLDFGKRVFEGPVLDHRRLGRVVNRIVSALTTQLSAKLQHYSLGHDQPA